MAVGLDATILPDQLEHNFNAAGYSTTQKLRYTQARPDGAIVFSASRVQPATTTATTPSPPQPVVTEQIGGQVFVALLVSMETLLLNRPTRHGSTAPRGARFAFQPVWDINAWSTTGLELYVSDDSDACFSFRPGRRA